MLHDVLPWSIYARGHSSGIVRVAMAVCVCPVCACAVCGMQGVPPRVGAPRVEVGGAHHHNAVLEGLIPPRLAYCHPSNIALTQRARVHSATSTVSDPFLMSSTSKDVLDTLEGFRRKVLTSVDWGIKSVSTTVSSTAVSAQDEANKLLDKSKARTGLGSNIHIDYTVLHDRNCPPSSQMKRRQ